MEEQSTGTLFEGTYCLHFLFTLLFHILLCYFIIYFIILHLEDKTEYCFNTSDLRGQWKTFQVRQQQSAPNKKKLTSLIHVAMHLNNWRQSSCVCGRREVACVHIHTSWEASGRSTHQHATQSWPRYKPCLHGYSSPTRGILPNLPAILSEPGLCTQACVCRIYHEHRLPSKVSEKSPGQQSFSGSTVIPLQ